MCCDSCMTSGMSWFRSAKNASKVGTAKISPLIVLHPLCYCLCGCSHTPRHQFVAGILGRWPAHTRQTVSRSPSICVCFHRCCGCLGACGVWRSQTLVFGFVSWIYSVFGWVGVGDPQTSLLKRSCTGMTASITLMTTNTCGLRRTNQWVYTRSSHITIYYLNLK